MLDLLCEFLNHLENMSFLMKARFCVMNQKDMGDETSELG